jgi:hypothetical protein
MQREVKERFDGYLLPKVMEKNVEKKEKEKEMKLMIEIRNLFCSLCCR